MNETQVAVLIVGGGLSGLAASLFLRQQGVDCRLIERSTSTSQLLRSTHVSSRTLELFRTVGIQKAIHDVAEKVILGENWTRSDLPPHQLPRVILRARSLQDVADGDVIVMEAGTDDFTEVSPAEPVWCGQDRVEPIMVREAERRGARISFTTEMTSFSQDSVGVTATVRDRTTGAEQVIRAQYLIAADGAGGKIRPSLGIGRTGNGTAGHVLNVLFEADLDSILGGRRFLILYLSHPDAPGMLFKLDEKRWIFGLFCGPEEIADGRLSHAECANLIRTATGVADLEIRVDSTLGWWMAHEIADSYRSGRVFLVGDACHVLPPTGGFGANAGIQDSSNLAWKLAGVLNGWAAPELLDTYETERRPVGQATADQAWLRHERWSGPGGDGLGQQVHQTVITTGYRYLAGALVGGTSTDVLNPELNLDGSPGSRLPHAWLSLNGRRLSSLDLTGEAFVLLAGPHGAAWTEAADRIADRLGIPLRAHLVGPDCELSDVGGAFLDASGIGGHGALLVRPDGFVGWRSAIAVQDADETLHEVLRTMTARAEVPAT
ncbi:FAD-dependent monooxygenase [Amycolatopsis decaplanina]|uniref:PheA/TfdB family FAD-binding monooxygenase n=1 Tax=Amycolatopsis decaplanina DSM 44594 TaxID=1284240 RepID=M2Y7R5_9PSEU|nr:FAD-dependent monooxygenase [Amycolatopsis decaplanina]EME57635.1 PheA/TfdB family FAD-binding monooxygenase [Amycolatopsis decaplanina DSM 44594]